MGRGFLAGIFWGAIVGIGMLLVSSQALERRSLSLPQPQATAVEVPGGTEFDQARVESDPVVPDTDERPATESVGLSGVPSDAVEETPSFDTSALEVPTPSVGEAGALSEAPDITSAPEAPVASEESRPEESTADLVVPEAPGTAPDTGGEVPESVADVLPIDDAEPETPATDAAPEETVVAALPDTDEETSIGADTLAAPTVTTGNAAPSAPQAPAVDDSQALPGVADGDDEAAELPWLEALNKPAQPDAPEGLSSAPESPDAPALPQVVEGGNSETGESLFGTVETLDDQASDVETDRLPRVGDAADDVTATNDEQTDDTANSDEQSEEVASATTPERTLPTIRRLGQDNSTPAEETEPEAVEEEDEAEVVDESGPALQRFAMAFEKPEGAVLMSIVLVQTGLAIPSKVELSTLPASVSFAVNAGLPGAGDIANVYRSSEREVVMIPSLPEGASPQDVEQALRVNFETIPEAVAMMDVSGSSFQSDRSAVQQVVSVASDTGHGMITFPRGLNTAHQSAQRAGVPAGLIFRRLDGAGETGEQIRRGLDRAAFRARPDDAVILVGSTNPETLAAIVEWAAGNRAKSVMLAPISAALSN